MALCVGCGDSVPEGALSCPSCGHEMDSCIPCPKCGFPVKPGDSRCCSCGRVLGEPYVYMSPRFGLRMDAADIQPTGGALRVSFDAASAWPAQGARRGFLSWASLLGALRVDPLYVGALACAVASLVFTWFPRYDVILAGAALITALLGYMRHFRYKHRGRYKGLWINHLATILGICGLVAGFGITAFRGFFVW